jgi:hypothetical protein
VRVTHPHPNCPMPSRAEPRRSFDAVIARVRVEPHGVGEPRVVRRRVEEGRTTEESRAADCRSTSASARAGQHGAEPSLPELREAVRAIPPAIWAGRLQGGAAVELSFGRELSVVLRQGVAGIEIAVRTDAALARAARVDLPALVRSLRARGVEVARAEVRGGAPVAARATDEGGRAVDARPPLR